MEVVFNCFFYDFHKDYCYNIADELKKRGHRAIISSKHKNYPNADFTIQPDEIYTRTGAKTGIWIGHGMDAKDIYFRKDLQEKIKQNADYLFVYSEAYKKHFKGLGIPTYVVGMPRLDKLFNIKKKETLILHAPTHDSHLKSKINKKELEKYGKVISIPHPSEINDEKIKSIELLKKATIVISDYSSVGLEAIALNIPTILIENKRIKLKKDYLPNQARNAAVRINDRFERKLKEAIETYLEDPKYLEEERLAYSKELLEYQGCASKRFVDVLEKLWKSPKSRLNQRI